MLHFLRSAPTFQKKTSSLLSRITTFAALGVLAGCAHEIAEPEPPAIVPQIYSVALSPNPNNVLSALAEVRSENAATLAVEYGADSLFQQSTPVTQVRGNTTPLAVLGLSPSTKYFMRVRAISSTGHNATSAAQAFTTATLPGNLPQLTVIKNELPSPGLVMLGFTALNNFVKSQVAVVNNDGRVMWYRQFARPVIDFQKQTNGHYTVYSSLDDSPAHFYELDQAGNVLQEFYASAGRATGAHELRLFDGRYCLFGLEDRSMDLTGIGGLPNATVRGMVIEYHRSNSSFFWSTFEHLEVNEASPDINTQVADVSPWHCNAIEVDRDDHLLVSFRNSDQIVKINSQTGAIIWRLGGKKNDFTFVNDPLNGFSHQHGIRRLANGNVILFDNGNLHTPPTSRAVEYRLDEQAKTATLVWEYRHEPALFGFAMGFAQRLENGNTLICYGIAQRIIEVDASGNKVWDLRIDEPNRFAYRAFRIESLY